MSNERFEILGRESKRAPHFLGRYTRFGLSLPPIRAYFHDSDFEETFGGKPSRSSMQVAADHLCSTVNCALVEDANFLLAAVWGENGRKMVDLFRYKNIQDWPGNPDVRGFVFQDGIYMPDKKMTTCGDTLIALGIEEQYRRFTNNVNEYMPGRPVIPGLVAIEIDR